MNKQLVSLGLLFLPLIGGMLSPKMSKRDKRWYDSLQTADMTPPDDMFPVVWSIMYIFLGLNAVLMYLGLGDGLFWDGYFPFFLLQLVLQWMWSYFFFKKRDPSTALLILAMMLVSALALIVLSLKVSSAAFMFMVAYSMWILFAGYLNLYVVQNN